MGLRGIGTATYYEPRTKKFAALRSWNNRCGHKESNSNSEWRSCEDIYPFNKKG